MFTYILKGIVCHALENAGENMKDAGEMYM
jgi:hypothetical protein